MCGTLLLSRCCGGGGEGDGLGDVVGADFPKLFGVGFFDERLVVAMDDVRGIAGPARGADLVRIGLRSLPLSLPLRCMLMAKRRRRLHVEAREKASE